MCSFNSVGDGEEDEQDQQAKHSLSLLPQPEWRRRDGWKCEGEEVNRTQHVEKDKGTLWENKVLSDWTYMSKVRRTYTDRTLQYLRFYEVTPQAALSVFLFQSNDFT